MFRSNLLKNIYQTYKWRLIFVYLLNIIQEIAYLFIPAGAGMLINTFFSGTGYGIWVFAGIYITWQGVATFRRIMDTIVFTRVYNEICLKTIEHHRTKEIPTSKINARIELLKEVVLFFEGDLPFLLNSCVMMFGAAALLYFYNTTLMFICLIILVPSLIFNYFFGKKMVAVTQLVNNQYERQFDVLEKEDLPTIRDYFEKLRLLNIRRSNLEAYNFGTLEIFVFIMIVASIYVICNTPNISYGDIVATYGYILRFAYSFDFIPHITAKVAIIKDIQQRLEDVYAE